MLTYYDLREVFITVETPPWSPGRTDDSAWLTISQFVETQAENELNLGSWLSLWVLLV